MFNTVSIRCPFFLSTGQRVFNTLQSFMQNQYSKKEYTKVQIHNMFDFDLWDPSGHAANYKDNMFSLYKKGSRVWP